MATPDIESRVDEIYQLPLDQFTAARNALAKELKQSAIKDLEKPSLAAWAVNQLYWKERETHDRLTETADGLRAEHRKLLTGKSADIRAAEQAHRAAVRAALDTIKRVLTDGGHAATEATLTAVQETLEALPADDAPGRLVKPLKPRGFEALAGLPGLRPQAPGLRPQAPGPRTQGAGARPQGTGPGHQGAGVRAQASAASPLKLVKSATDAKREREEAKRREKEERERKDRQKEAEKELKAAEATMLRAEEAVKKAEKALGELRAARDEAVSEYQRARLRARE
jgi:hypothetical protein